MRPRPTHMVNRMPDENDKKLSKEQKDKFKQWLDSKGKIGVCPVCESNKWFMGDHLTSGVLFADGGTHLGGPVYPQAMIVCENCAYVRHFMAIPIGLTEGDQPEDNSDG